MNSENKEMIKNGLVLNIAGIEGYCVVTEFVPSNNYIKLLNLNTEQEIEREYDLIHLALQSNSHTIVAVQGEEVIGIMNDRIQEKTTLLRQLRKQIDETEDSIKNLSSRKNLIRGCYESVLR